MEKYLDSQIRQRQERLREIEKERIALLAELRAYEDMKQHLIAEEGTEGRRSDISEAKATAPTSAFEMSPMWLAIMRKLCERGRSFSAGDMVRIGKELGNEPKMTNARSQIRFYGDKGYIRRVRRGQYSITPKGHDAFNKEAPSGGPESASNNTGEVGASPDESGGYDIFH